MKIRLRVYERRYKGVLKQAFSTMEEAEQAAGRMAEKHPGMIFEPYAESDKPPAKNRTGLEGLDTAETTAIDLSKLDDVDLFKRSK